MRLRTILPMCVLFCGTLLSNCSKESSEKPEPPVYDMSGFARGADLSWLTEMESNGRKFYSSNGVESECMNLLREIGLNSIRLRVWVDPLDGWCNKEDMLEKAKRAHLLGMRLMIDFHYSDSWADPGKQTKPAQWEGEDLQGLKSQLANHTIEVLNLLKSNGITPEWVQVGNETGNGMLWEEGKASVNMSNYAELNNAGYEAVKSVFPSAKVIVHLQNGQDNSLFRWLFDGLKSNGGKWDVIGMSLYPTATTWQSMNNQCLSNIQDMIERYNTEVMICEVGMPWEQSTASYNFLKDLRSKCESVDDGRCLGVFYWEPQAYDGWKGYSLGAFTNNGRATKALDAFKKD
ncbi:MAG: glycoside hydrolase family 53 protein [Bacteroidales bacterium]